MQKSGIDRKTVRLLIVILFSLIGQLFLLILDHFEKWSELAAIIGPINESKIFKLNYTQV